MTISCFRQLKMAARTPRPTEEPRDLRNGNRWVGATPTHWDLNHPSLAYQYLFCQGIFRGEVNLISLVEYRLDT